MNLSLLKQMVAKYLCPDRSSGFDLPFGTPFLFSSSLRSVRNALSVCAVEEDLFVFLAGGIPGAYHSTILYRAWMRYFLLFSRVLGWVTRSQYKKTKFCLCVCAGIPAIPTTWFRRSIKLPALRILRSATFCSRFFQRHFVSSAS